MSNNAVIFDWNGTILDDAFCVLNATNYALSSVGVAPTTMEKYCTEYTIPLNKTYKALGCSEEQIEDKDGKLISSFFDHYQKHLVHTNLREGANIVLACLKQMNVKNAVLSNATVQIITEQSKRLGAYDFIDDVLAHDMDLSAPFRKSGKGDWLTKYVADQKIDQAIVVGDTPEEAEIANDHGFVSILITGGTCTRQRLEDAKPDFLISDFAEITDIAKKVFA